MTKNVAHRSSKYWWVFDASKWFATAIFNIKGPGNIKEFLILDEWTELKDIAETINSQ